MTNQEIGYKRGIHITYINNIISKVTLKHLIIQDWYTAIYKTSRLGDLFLRKLKCINKLTIAYYNKEFHIVANKIKLHNANFYK